MTPLAARCPTRLIISPRTQEGRIRGRLGTRIARPGESQRDDLLGSDGAMRHGAPVERFLYPHQRRRGSCPARDVPEAGVGYVEWFDVGYVTLTCLRYGWLRVTNN